MAGEFEKLFGPKVTKDKPKWPSGVGVGLIPHSIHPLLQHVAVLAVAEQVRPPEHVRPEARRVIDRADRLHLVLAQLRGVPYLWPEEAFAMTPLTPVGMATVEEVTTEDLALATELINIEAELREKEYKALERLAT